MEKGLKVIAELIITPHGEGTSLSKYVKVAIKVIDLFPNIRVMHTPMSSIIEANSIEQVLAVARIAHGSLFEAGAKRVSTTIRIDDRRDKPRTMEDKIDSVIGE